MTNVLHALFNRDILTIDKKIDRYMQLRKYVSEYEKLKSEIKALTQDKELVQFKNYQITGKYVNVKEKTIPAYRYWAYKIKEK